MQRSEALAPLSRDHHHALVVARGLTRASEADAVQAAGAFVKFLTQHELEHFAIEEAVLLPAAEATQEGERLGARMVEEHAQLRADLDRLRSQGAPPESSLLHEIGRRLRAHVLLEERELFPHLEESLSEDALKALGSRIAERSDHR